MRPTVTVTKFEGQYPMITSCDTSIFEEGVHQYVMMPVGALVIEKVPCDESVCWQGNDIELSRHGGCSHEFCEGVEHEACSGAGKVWPDHVEAAWYCYYPEFNDAACYAGTPEKARQPRKHTDCGMRLIVDVAAQESDDETEAERVLEALATEAWSEDDPRCAFCNLTERYIVHSDESAKGYHPFEAQKETE